MRGSLQGSWRVGLCAVLPLLAGCQLAVEERQDQVGAPAAVVDTVVRPLAIAPPLQLGAWDAAQMLVAAGAIDEALVRLDSVPPRHADAPRAAVLAHKLEKRLQRSQERLLAGLVCRSQRRDPEALTCFAEARELWSGAPVRGLIAATRARMAMGASGFRPGAESDLAPVVDVFVGVPQAESVSAEPAAEPTDEDARSSLAVLVVDHLPPGVTVRRASRDAVGTRPVASAPSRLPEPAIRRLVARAQRLLEVGDLGAAVRLLSDGERRSGGDGRVRRLLGDVLSQRALLAYGRGGLEAAVRDWRRVLEITPGRRTVEASLRAAETELHQRRRP